MLLGIKIKNVDVFLEEWLFNRYNFFLFISSNVLKSNLLLV